MYIYIWCDMFFHQKNYVILCCTIQFVKQLWYVCSPFLKFCDSVWLWASIRSTDWLRKIIQPSMVPFRCQKGTHRINYGQFFRIDQGSYHERSFSAMILDSAGAEWRSWRGQGPTFFILDQHVIGLYLVSYLDARPYRGSGSQWKPQLVQAGGCWGAHQPWFPST